LKSRKSTENRQNLGRLDDKSDRQKQKRQESHVALASGVEPAITRGENSPLNTLNCTQQLKTVTPFMKTLLKDRTAQNKNHLNPQLKQHTLKWSFGRGAATLTYLG